MGKIERRMVSCESYHRLYSELAGFDSPFAMQCKNNVLGYLSKLNQQKLWLKLTPSLIKCPVGYMLDFIDMGQLENYIYSYAMLMDLVPDLKGKKIAHLGCGPGLFLAFLKETYGISAFGVEKSDFMAGDAHKEGKIAVVHGDALDLPLQDESVDVIIANHFLADDYFELSEISALLRESWRALRPGIMVAGFSSVGDIVLEESPFRKVYSYDFPVKMVGGARNLVLQK